MDERRESPAAAPIGGELLAAYLAAETDEVTSARIERRLRDDPETAARLDALARTRARLQRLDAVPPPPGLRTRLDARLRAERAERAAHAQPVERGDHLQRVAADAAGPPPAATAAAPATTPATARARWRQRWRGAPFAAAAAVVLVAVIGGAALLGQSGSMDEVATDSAGGEAADATAAAPFAAPEAGDDAGTLEAQEDSGNAQADDRSSTTADGDGAEAVPALPRVRDDDDIAARLDDPERATDDPPGAEAALRLRYGLAPQPLCLAGVDAAAVDIVEVDGAAVLSTLERGDDGRQVALYDVGLCSRLRTFAP